MPKSNQPIQAGNNTHEQDPTAALKDTLAANGLDVLKWLKEDRDRYTKYYESGYLLHKNGGLEMAPNIPEEMKDQLMKQIGASPIGIQRALEAGGWRKVGTVSELKEGDAVLWPTKGSEARDGKLGREPWIGIVDEPSHFKGLVSFDSIVTTKGSQIATESPDKPFNLSELAATGRLFKLGADPVQRITPESLKAATAAVAENGRGDNPVLAVVQQATTQDEKRQLQAAQATLDRVRSAAQKHAFRQAGNKMAPALPVLDTFLNVWLRERSRKPPSAYGLQERGGHWTITEPNKLPTALRTVLDRNGFLSNDGSLARESLEVPSEEMKATPYPTKKTQTHANAAKGKAPQHDLQETTHRPDANETFTTRCKALGLFPRETGPTDAITPVVRQR